MTSPNFLFKHEHQGVTQSIEAHVPPDEMSALVMEGIRTIGGPEGRVATLRVVERIDKVCVDAPPSKSDMRPAYVHGAATVVAALIS